MASVEVDQFLLVLVVLVVTGEAPVVPAAVAGVGDRPFVDGVDVDAVDLRDVLHAGQAGEPDVVEVLDRDDVGVREGPAVLVEQRVGQLGVIAGYVALVVRAGVGPLGVLRRLC